MKIVTLYPFSHSIGMFDNKEFVFTKSFSNDIFALSYICNDVMRFPHPEFSECTAFYIIARLLFAIESNRKNTDCFIEIVYRALCQMFMKECNFL